MATNCLSQPGSFSGRIRWFTGALRGCRTNQVLRSGAVVACISFLCRLASAGKEMLVASRLGTSDELDIFLLAFLIPSIIVTVIVGSLGVAVIPQVVTARKEGGEEQVRQLYSSTLIGAFTASLCIVAAICLALPLLISRLAAGFTLVKIQATVHVCMILMPMCSIVALTQLWSALLNANRRFLVPSAVPCATTLVVIFAVSRLTSRAGAAEHLAYATLIGSIVEAVIMGAALRSSGFTLMPGFNSFDSRFWLVAREFLFVSLASIMDGFVNSFNQSAAAGLGSGSIAALNYGTRLVTVIASVCSIAVGTVLLPHFSEIAASEDWSRLARTARKYVIGSFTLLFLLTLVLIYTSEPTVRLLFERGSFTHLDTEHVARIYAVSALRLPFMIPSLIGARLLITLRATNRLLAVTVLNVAVTAMLVPVLSRSYGLPGIALSGAVMYCLCTVAVFLFAAQLFRSRLRTTRPELARAT